MRIPKEAKRVFKGVLYDVYHWDQQMYDGTTETFEMLKRSSTVEVIAVEDGSILIAEQQQPHMPSPRITLFGGRQEPGEDLLAVATRELQEESGRASDDWELLKTYDADVGKIDWSVTLFAARHCKKIAEQQLDPGERISVRSVSFDEFVEIVSSERFWGGFIVNDILRMRLDPPQLEAFRKKLLGL